MKKGILSLFLMACTFMIQAQDGNKTTDTSSFAELQTKELTEFFGLSDEIRKQVLQINLTCLDKNASLESTDMHPETIKKGKYYNEEQRQSSIKKLLTAEQNLIFEKFEHNCKYCK